MQEEIGALNVHRPQRKASSVLPLVDRVGKITYRDALRAICSEQQQPQLVYSPEPRGAAPNQTRIDSISVELARTVTTSLRLRLSLL